ncbi:ABC transporter substrate-binding protein [Stutzerimonas balearica]|uniref:ABC transporter substrate-binding protein n=1 Tax=Stutzerimonas balearica TaxID=74829 RepID=UPI00378703D3
MKHHPLPYLVTVLLAGLLALPAQARQVTDALGNQIEVPDRPERIVTLSEIDLDTTLSLGLTPVGTSNGRGQAAAPRYLSDRLPAELPTVGELDNPNLETLLELQPDLILTGPAKPEQLALLNEIAPTVVSYSWGEPWQQSMRRTASILGREAEGRAALARYAARVAEARARLAAHQGETVSIVRWNPKGPSYMFKDAFASTIIEDLGLRRPAHQQDAGHTHSMALSLESLELLDADWLVVGTLATRGEAVEAMRQAERTPAFGRLTAIQAKRFGTVDGSLWTSVGGPLAALQVIEDVETLLGKEDARPVESASAGR